MEGSSQTSMVMPQEGGLMPDKPLMGETEAGDAIKTVDIPEGKIVVHNQTIAVPDGCCALDQTAGSQDN